MATGSEGGAEDFVLNSKRQQDDESHILIIHLPAGLTKEQIKTSIECRNSYPIRVDVENLVACKKWSRLFRVPENDETCSAGFEFKGERLKIMIPKGKIDISHEKSLESHVRIMPLPGLTKEQIKVSVESRNTNTITINVESLVDCKKWARHFQFSENSEINSIGFNFQGENLKITIPKENVNKPHETLAPKPKSNEIQKQPATLRVGMLLVALTAYVTYKFASEKDKN